MASSPELNQWNEGWRQSPRYAEILQSVGVDPSRPFKLSDQQRKQVQSAIEQAQGSAFPQGTEIDPAGNMNENEGFGKQAKKWGPLVGAAAITAFGIPGVMPGMFGGIGTGTAASSATGAAAGGKVATGAGFFRKAAGFLKNPLMQAGIGAVGSGMSNAANASAHNRGVQLEADIAKAGLEQQAERDYYGNVVNRAQLEQQAERDYNTQVLKREEEGRAKQANAWEKMNRAASRRDAPSNVNRTMLSPYSKSLAGPSADVRAASSGMFDQMAQQLREGNTLEAPRRVGVGLEDPRRVGTNVQVQKPGMLEKIGGIVGPMASGYGYLSQMAGSRNGRPPQQPAPPGFYDPDLSW